MTFTIETTATVDVRDITDEVAARIPDTIDEGLCTVFVPHTTAGITVNEAEPRLLADLRTLLETLVEDTADWGHDAIDDNAAAHLRTMLVGADTTIPIRDGALAVGTWQSILLVESDGPRTRQVSVTTTTGESA